MVALAGDIKLSHSLFAMPFAILAAFLVRPIDASWWRFGVQVSLVVACMVCARSFAMLANRILDRDLDALNPRTAGRALPSRRARLRDALVALIGFGALFIALTGVFGFALDNWWPLLLSLPVLAWIGAYPLFKRFTWWCHVYLGSSLALSPLAAAIAVEPAALAHQPSLWALSLAVLLWVAGFDILYALQDLAVDQEQAIRSIPSRFGVSNALWISRAMHLGSVGALVAVALFDARLGPLFWLAMGMVTVLLVVEHRVTHGGTTARIQLAFFTLNGVISLLLGAMGIVSLLLSPSI